MRRPEENVGEEHWAQRETFFKVAYPELGKTFTQVGAKWVAPGLPWRTGPRAPLLGEHTGEVLAMVSRPAFDPNLFSKGISRADWAELSSDTRNPLLNRAIQAQLAPGSVYKILMATAGLETGVATEDTAGDRDFVLRRDFKGTGRLGGHFAVRRLIATNPPASGPGTVRPEPHFQRQSFTVPGAAQ